eukprot:746305-Hanusia_phi.AAC.2
MTDQKHQTCRSCSCECRPDHTSDARVDEMTSRGQIRISAEEAELLIRMFETSVSRQVNSDVIDVHVSITSRQHGQLFDMLKTLKKTVPYGNRGDEAEIDTSHSFSTKIGTDIRFAFAQKSGVSEVSLDPSACLSNSENSKDDDSNNDRGIEPVRIQLAASRSIDGFPIISELDRILMETTSLCRGDKIIRIEGRDASLLSDNEVQDILQSINSKPRVMLECQRRDQIFDVHLYGECCWEDSEVLSTSPISSTKSSEEDEVGKLDFVQNESMCRTGTMVGLETLELENHLKPNRDVPIRCSVGIAVRKDPNGLFKILEMAKKFRDVVEKLTGWEGSQVELTLERWTFLFHCLRSLCFRSRPDQGVQSQKHQVILQRRRTLQSIIPIHHEEKAHIANEGGNHPLCGIGVTFAKHQDLFVVSNMFKGGPADQSGMVSFPAMFPCNV